MAGVYFLGRGEGCVVPAVTLSAWHCGDVPGSPRASRRALPLFLTCLSCLEDSQACRYAQCAEVKGRAGERGKDSRRGRGQGCGGLPAAHTPRGAACLPERGLGSRVHYDNQSSAKPSTSAWPAWPHYLRCFPGPPWGPSVLDVLDLLGADHVPPCRGWGNRSWSPGGWRQGGEG